MTAAPNGAVLLIGAGRMGSALLKGWLARGVKSIAVVEPKPSAALRNLARARQIQLCDSPSQVKGRVSVCIVAIKPQILKGEAPALADFATSGSLMISIAAGTSIAALRKAWGNQARIIRAMPNTPGAIGEGITGLYAAKGVTPADRKRATQLLAALGETIWVAREGLIDSVTAVSGSGPAYLFLMAEALTEAGVSEGLTRAQAEAFASDWKGGFYCPCHGSLFDLAGRVYKNKPAPDNLIVPPHKFLADGLILIGEDANEKGA